MSKNVINHQLKNYIDGVLILDYNKLISYPIITETEMKRNKTPN